MSSAIFATGKKKKKSVRKLRSGYRNPQFLIYKFCQLEKMKDCITLHIGATRSMPSHSLGSLRRALRATAPPID